MNSVHLRISADTSAFSASIRQAEQDFSTHLKQMGQTSGFQSKRIKTDFNHLAVSAKQFGHSLKQTAKQLTILAGTATGIGILGKKMFEVADGIAKAADRTGVSTAMLQELRYAGAQTGVSTEKLESSLERFTKRIGEAASGVGAAVGTFQKLGIQILASDGSIRSTEVLLNEVADALANMDSQAERAAATAALFGREGVALSLLLKDGAKGLEVYREQARALGIVIDESLLRNSEIALDQFDMLAQVIKAQLVSAFVSIAPAVIQFTQSIINALPAIRQFVANIADFKDNLVFAAQSFIGLKIVGFTKNMMNLSQGLIAASIASGKLAMTFGLLGKAIKGIGIGVAVGVVIDGLKLIKQHLDFNQSINQYLSSQERIVTSNQEFSSTARLSADALKLLTQSEQQAYKTRLQSAQQYWQARLSLESRQDFQSSAAFEAAKESRLIQSHLTEIDALFKQRNAQAKMHAETFAQVKQQETAHLKSILIEQLKSYDDANQKLTALQDKRKEIAKEFQELVQEINVPPEKSSDQLNALDIVNAQENAKAALKSGDVAQAYQAIEQAKNIIQALSKTGQVTKAYLTEQTKATAEIADKIVQSEIQTQEASLSAIQTKITQIKADAELLQHLSIAFDVDSAVQSADEMRNQLQAQLAKNPLVIPAVVVPNGQNAEAKANQILAPQKKARGGLILGAGTSTSDSILARLSRGEYVIRASAVKRYGLNLLNQLNQLQLPKFATGGLVPPMVPALPLPSPSTHQVANLTLQLGANSYQMQTQNVDVVQALTKAVAREALKSGRRV